MPDHAHNRDLRLFLQRHADNEPVQIHIGKTGFGEMSVGDLLAVMAPTDETCECSTCPTWRADAGRVNA